MMTNQMSVVLSLFMLFLVTGSFAQSKEEKEIKKVITSFTKGGDKQDVQIINQYIDDNFRIVMNQLFGNKEVSILTKGAYLQKINSKEFGGDNRVVTFQQLVLNGNTACVKATLKGQKLTFTSIFLLVKNDTGRWNIVSETPVVQS